MAYHRAFDRRRYLNARRFYTTLELSHAGLQLADPRQEACFQDPTLGAMIGKPSMAKFNSRLTSEQRETIQLFFDGYALKEISDLTGRSISNVRSHFYRGLERLRKYVLPEKLRSKANRMVHNGSSQGAWTLPTDPHQEFRELCALSTTGELTAEDWYRLTEHLAGCADCRGVKAQYERVAEVMIPVLASGVHSGAAEDSEDDLPPGSWSIVDAEARLMKSLEDEPAPSRMRPTPIRPSPPERVASQWHSIRRLATAALIVLAIGAGGYWFGTLRDVSRRMRRHRS